MHNYIIFTILIFLPFNSFGGYCQTDSIASSTPDNQLRDNGDGTVLDLKTGLMWKKCLEGLDGDQCDRGSALTFTWVKALEQQRKVRDARGWAGYNDWRIPNVMELLSIVEDACNPSINIIRFPNQSYNNVWSSSPAYSGDTAWVVYFGSGIAQEFFRSYTANLRMVRSSL